MLCAKCHAQVARDAYYCKSCGEVIDDTIAPGLKLEDRRITSRVKYAIQRHLIRNLVVGIFILLFAIAGIKVALNNVQANKDNGSSKIYQLTVLGLQDPMTCRGAICHILIDVKNKTNSVQKLDAISTLVTASGKKYGPADPNRMGNGSNYCRTKISLTLQPHELARDIGVCAQDIPAGTGMVLAELRDSSGAVVVSGVFKAVAY
jgi:hypothetical protein